MRLVYVTTADFRNSELTIFNAVLQERPALADMAANSVICVRNRQGDQVMFLHGYVPIWGAKGEELYALRSERLRLDKRRPWNPMMLANYAMQVGFKLEGVKTFEEHMKQLTATVAQAFDMKRAQVKSRRRR